MCDWKQELNTESYKCPHKNYEKSKDGTKDLCIFHSDREEKDPEVFYQGIKKIYESKEHNFIGFVFPKRFNFERLEKDIKPNRLIFTDANFTDAVFLCDFHLFSADFIGEGRTSFAGAKFFGEGRTEFFEARFSCKGGTSFNFAQFIGEGRTSFSGATFTGEGRTEFVGAKFSSKDGTVFFRVLFSANAGTDFTGAQFSGEGGASFNEAQFSGEGGASFYEVQFSGEGGTVFSGATFSGERGVDFTGAEFSGEGRVYFNKALFLGKGVANFRSAYFSNEKGVSFYESQFFCDGGVNFSEATFSGNREVDFSRSVFHGSGKVIFDSVDFNCSGDVRFNDVTFTQSGSASFRHSTFSPKVEFIFSHFKGDVDIENAFFKNNVSFIGLSNDENYIFSRKSFANLSNITFAAPERVIFSMVDLSKASLLNTDLLSVRLNQIHWEKSDPRAGRIVIHDEDRLIKEKIGTHQQVSALYQQLRVIYEKAGKYFEAGDFFIGEMEMRRLATEDREPLHIRCILNLYKYISNYGQNPLTAFLWILFFLSLFGLWYETIDLQPIAQNAPNLGDLSGYCNGIFLSLDNLTLGRLNPGFEPSNKTLGMVIKTLEMISATILYPLFLLAMNRKFRRTKD